jgi:Sulfotransferase family
LAPPVDVDSVGLMLAGLAGAADAARRLGLDHCDLSSLLADLNLGQAAMVPVAIDDELACYYADVGMNAFELPLFDSVLESHGTSPVSANIVHFRLSADVVLGAAAMSLGRAPGGLMFHVGRCGSTLLCNLLASVGGWVALREPEFLNTLLRRLAAERDRGRKDRLGVIIAQSLRSLANGVRRDAERRERACVVKLSSWGAMMADDLVTTFNATPLVVVTRDPCATVASFLRDPPHWHDARSMGGDRKKAVRFFAEVWSGTIDAALRFPSERTLFIDYAEIVAQPSTTLASLCCHLGDTARPSSKAIDIVMANYSKGPPGERFEAHGRHRPQRLEEAERDLVESITAISQTALRERRACGG